jgi:hypothetical protein
MSIEKGKDYTWPEIIKLLDADYSEPVYALHRRAKLVCFALNRWQHPNAPDEILVGFGENRERFADDCIRDRPVIPIFIRESQTERRWWCAGYFQIYGHTDEISEKNKRLVPKVIPSIYKILFMEEAPG